MVPTIIYITISSAIFSRGLTQLSKCTPGTYRFKIFPDNLYQIEYRIQTSIDLFYVVSLNGTYFSSQPGPDSHSRIVLKWGLLLNGDFVDQFGTIGSIWLALIYNFKEGLSVLLFFFVTKALEFEDK